MDERADKEPIEELDVDGFAVDIDELEIEDFDVPEEQDTEIEDESGGSTTYALIGTGQGGSRIAKAFYDIGYKKTIVLNSTQKDLQLIDMPESQKYLMQIEKEGGAGKDMGVGAKAADLHESEIKRLMEGVFGSKVDHILVSVGAGGGTGAGSAKKLIQIAKEYVDFHIRNEAGEKINPGNRVGVILALPTRGEAVSPLVKKNAYEVVSELYEMADKKEISPLIIIDNDRIDKMFGKSLTVKNYWPTINKQIAGLFHTFNTLSNAPSEFTSFDPADYQSIMRCGGCCTMGVAKVKDYEDRSKVIAAIKNNLEKTLLAPNFKLKTSRFAGVIAVAGSAILGSVPGLSSTINSAFDMFSELLSSNVNLHRGIYEGTRDSLTVYTIVSGLELCEKRIEQLK